MNQKEYFGFDSIKNLKNILKQEDPKKIFLVTGKKSYEKSGAKNSIVKYLQNYDFVHYDNCKSHQTYLNDDLISIYFICNFFVFSQR